MLYPRQRKLTPKHLKVNKKQMNTLLKFFALAFFSTIFFVKNGFTQAKNIDSFKIQITLKPLQNQTIYLASYYGTSNIIIDSCVLDNNSIGYFKGDKKLIGGIYIIVNSSYKMLFDIIIGTDQYFSIAGDTLRKNLPIVKGSRDNDLFKIFNDNRATFEKEVIAVSSNLAAAKTAQDSIKIKAAIKAKSNDFLKYKEDFIQKNAGSLMVTLLNANSLPDVPEIPMNPITKNADSSYPYQYVKNHFWDNVNFADIRLLRTPFFERKIDDYFKKYISPEADSIIPEVKFMLLSARTSTEMYAYLLIKFTNKYLQPAYMGQDKVFVTLFNEFYLKGDTTILDLKSRKSIIDRGYFLMLNQINQNAAPLDLVDSLGKIISLYNIKSKFVFVAFWSPSCGHCKDEIPVLDSLYKQKWSNLGVKVYSILSDENLLPELKNFINDKKLSQDWYYTYETKAMQNAVTKSGEMPFRQAYDFTQTPVFYLLDANKKIIAKRLSLHQFDDLISRKSK